MQKIVKSISTEKYFSVSSFSRKESFKIMEKQEKITFEQVNTNYVFTGKGISARRNKSEMRGDEMGVVSLKRYFDDYEKLDAKKSISKYLIKFNGEEIDLVSFNPQNLKTMEDFANYGKLMLNQNKLVKEATKTITNYQHESVIVKVEIEIDIELY